MRILVATYHAYSHVTTVLPLVQRLIRRGHTVRWLADHRVMVKRSGATHLQPVYTPSHHGVPAKPLREWVAMFAADAMAQAADLTAALEDEPADLLLIDPTIGGVAAVAPGYPDMRVGMIGCVPLLHIPNGVQFVVQPTLPQCEYPVETAWRERVFFTGPLLPPPMDELSSEEQAAFAARIPTDRPLVLITHGTLATDYAMLVEPAVRACADLPVFAIVQAKPGDLDLPDNALALPWLPFPRLLPHAALMVSNGGYQGAQWCLAAGVPMVVHGQTEDKPDVAARVEWAGYGKNTSPFATEPGMFRAAISEVLANPRYREQAQRLAARARLMDSATAAAQIIEMHSPVKGRVDVAA